MEPYRIWRVFSKNTPLRICLTSIGRVVRTCQAKSDKLSTGCQKSGFRSKLLEVGYLAPKSALLKNMAAQGKSS